MKTAFFLIGLALMFVTVFSLDESAARVSTVDVLQQTQDETVTGTYEGYKNQNIYILHNDGTRRVYPFKPDDYLLRRISRTRLATRVTIKVENGIVVRFEEVPR